LRRSRAFVTYLIKLMFEWWDAIQLERQIFYGIGIVSLLLLLLQLGLSLIGAELDHFDLPGAGEHGSGASILSIRSVTAFFTGFGWVGAICLNRGMSLPMSILVAVTAGAVLMFSTYFLMLGMLALQSSGTLDYKNALAQVGTVYSTIPAARSHAGQVEVMIQGRYVTAEAFTTHPKPLKPGAKVRVTELIGTSTLLVEPL